MWVEMHLQVLRQGPLAWNKWRQANLDIVPDLSGVALALNERRWGPDQGGPINFKQVQFRSVNFSYAALPDANFEYATLDQSDLTGASLIRVNFRGASLRDVHFAAADLREADFTDADLRGADLRGALHLHASQIQGARGDLHTQLPEYIVPPISWRNTGRKVYDRPLRPGATIASTAQDIPTLNSPAAAGNQAISIKTIAAVGLVIIGAVITIQYALQKPPASGPQIADNRDQTAGKANEGALVVTPAIARTPPVEVDKNAAEAAAWALVQRNPTHDIMKSYLMNHPKGPHAREVQQQYDLFEAEETRQREEVAEKVADAAAWAKVQRDPNHDALHTYLVNYPHGLFADVAQRQYDQLEADEAKQRAKFAKRRSDELAWAKVRNNPTRTALRGYLASHADGKRAAEAREKIAALGEPAAPKSDTAAKSKPKQRKTMAAAPVSDPIAEKLLAIKKVNKAKSMQVLAAAPQKSPPAKVLPAANTRASKSGNTGKAGGAVLRKSRKQIASLEAAGAKRANKNDGLVLKQGSGPDKSAAQSKQEQKEQKEWQQVQKYLTRESLRSYLVNYPNSKNAAIAKLQLSALGAEFDKRNAVIVSRAKARILAIIRKTKKQDADEWAKVQKNPTRDVLQAFIITNPGSEYVKIAKLQLAALQAVYAPKAKGNQVQGNQVRGNQVNNAAPEPESDSFRRAVARIESFARSSAREDKMAWAKVLKNPARNALLYYLSNWPHGMFVAKARTMISVLDAKFTRQKADAAAWSKVRKNPTRRALNAYLRAHGNGKYAPAAKKQIAALRAKAAKAAWRAKAVKRRASKAAQANQARKDTTFLRF